MYSYVQSLEGSGCIVPTVSLQHGSGSGFYPEFTAVNIPPGAYKYHTLVFLHYGLQPKS